MPLINNRIIGLAESQRNRSVLNQRPTYSSSFMSYGRYQNNKIFQQPRDVPTMSSRIGMNTNYELIAKPCIPISERDNKNQFGGFRKPSYKVKSGTGLSPQFFTNDRLGFTADLNQKPVIYSIY